LAVDGRVEFADWPLAVERRIAKQMYQRARDNARAKVRAFDLTVHDVRDLLCESNGRCSVTGAPFSLEPNSRRRKNPWAPSLDRIDAARGYVRGNVRVVCLAANIAMAEWGEKVLYTLARSTLGQQMVRQWRIKPRRKRKARQPLSR
jgi:hypothetical protein